MSLSRATLSDGTPLSLPGEPPFAAEDLRPYMNEPLLLPCEDPWIEGEPDEEAHAYLQGAADAWESDPDWMDVLDLESPAYDVKIAERDLYLHAWGAHLSAARVLDVGCGVGRMMMPFLDAGASVIGVDADLQSLQHAAWHAAGRAGRVDLHWSSVHHLPDERDFDVVLAVEVLCYVPDVESALRAIVERLRPGGTLLLSMEARWGWATGQDAPPGSLDEALNGTGIVHLPGETWVRTWERDELVELLERVGLQVTEALAAFYVTDGPLERCLGPSASLQELIAIEERARKHPIWGPLNRVWMVQATRPVG